MILELVGAVILVAALVVLIRMEADLHRTAETLGGIVKALENEPRRTARAAGLRPMPESRDAPDAQPAPASPRPDAEVAAAIAAARLAQLRLAATTGRNILLSGPAPAQTATPSTVSTPASPPAPAHAGKDRAEDDGVKGDRAGAHAAYDGMGSGFIDVIGSEPDVGYPGQTPGQGESR